MAIEGGKQICITAINVYEVLKGLKYKTNQKIQKAFNEFLDDIRVIHFDDNAASIAADIYADLRKKGITVGDADILIAAIVINYNGVLVSHNLKHYEHIRNLKLVDWTYAR
ncbi:hypothetical protein AGMMS49521_2190 [Campylobacterota bacterium]|nr:hypothetical protein AGMMS49521_2190 [Campylobacterota bacterium]